jgi:predicted metalloprotease
MRVESLVRADHGAVEIVMRWEEGRRSENVEDRRGSGGPRMAMAGGGGLIVLLLALLFGVNPASLFRGGGTQEPVEVTAKESELSDFVSVVLADTEDTWTALFQQMGREYTPPKLVLFRDAVESACGFQEAAVGPFYCPEDRRVYLDLSFFDDLSSKFGAPGDFAQAYVVAHEVGHHVQNLLGISQKVHALQGRAGEAEANDASVRLELQADFLAGVWAHHAQAARNVLESGDLEEALNAASQIGDDRLQRRSRGYVAPESFTHGTSAQRARWFKRGFTTGDVKQGDTFSAKDL